MRLTPAVATSPEWDRQLHQRIQRGDADAFDELYAQFSPMVYGLAVRVTGDRAAAADVTQEVFVRFWERPSVFDPSRGSLRAWMGMMAHRRAVDWVRREAVRRQYVAAEARQPPPPLPDAEEAAIASMVAKSVRSALDEVPEAQRAVIMLAYYEGRPQREIAGLLGIPEGTVKSRMHIGLRRFAERLRELDLVPGG